MAFTSAPSSSSSCPPIWDVFLSFYGKDTRRNFISHLYSALDQAGIKTFRDDPALEKGQEISSGLLTAIRDSKMFVVIISKNYACSPWCLKELVDILSCKKTENQVIPVFYYVDPTDLRYQKGSFGDALDYHYQKKRYSPDMINMWGSALAQIAELSGYHLKKQANENEAETIQKIVENIAPQVSTKVLHIGEELYGTDSAVKKIHRKLRMKSNDVRAIGICGMGGIGKTITAKAFYNKYHTNFDICCFIENVKKYSQGGSPLLPLLQQLLSALLRKKDYKVPDIDSGIRQLEEIFCSKKALVVLDDLDQSSCSEFLARHCSLFSAGSRIVITTRDKNLLNQLKIDLINVNICMVNALGEVDSLKLFNYHAFGKVTPPANLRELSKSFVTYTGGLPLALKVLGASLRGRSEDELFWKAKLEKVQNILENKIFQILQLSYNELDDETVKSIFLDIAFFFVEKHEDDAVYIFKSRNYYPEDGIQILLERCLITIDEDGIFHMHDLIQDMGREISKSTRLFLRENEWEYLQNQEELYKIEGLILDLTQSEEKQINSRIFEKLPNLRLLEIFNAHGIQGHFKNSFQELRCIYWSYCMWTRLPSSFRPQKLISMHMPYNNFKTLWDDARPFTSLKIINVDYSVNLEATPNFEKSKSVKQLYFRKCKRLLKVHPSIKELTGLYVLNLMECINVKVSAETLGQSSELGYLFLGRCSNIRQLPKQLGDMKWLKELDASFTAIEELPDSITKLKELAYLNLDGCEKLRKLPEQIGNMEGLRTFSASCTAIQKLPDSFAGLINLERLDLQSCKNLQNLPSSIWKLKLLRVLNLEFCSKLERLPYKLEKMQCLEELHASSTAIEEVPDSIGLLSGLRVLGLSNCEKLKYLPKSVWNLTSLTQLYLFQTDIGRINLPPTVKDTKLVVFSLKFNARVWLPLILSFSSLKSLALSYGGEILSSTKPVSFSKLYNLQYLALYNCTIFGSSFPELPLNITHLDLYDHATLIHLPDLSSLKKLKKLDIYSYVSLESLPPLPPHLQSLAIYNCTSLQYLSNMSMLMELIDLQVGMCSKRKSVGSKMSFLQVIDVRKHFLPFYKVQVPKIADWFSYKSSGHSISFDIPTLSADNFLGLALSILFTSENSTQNFCLKAEITNKTKATTGTCLIPVHVGNTKINYVVKCIRGDEITMRSGDRITILLQRQLYSLYGSGTRYTPDFPSQGGKIDCISALTFSFENVKIEMLAAHVIQRTGSTPDFPSVLDNLINTLPPRFSLSLVPPDKLTICIYLCLFCSFLWIRWIKCGSLLP